VLTDKTESFVVKYPQAVEFMNTQAHVFWPSDEIKVEKDVQDILTRMSPAEKHGVITVLKLFTKYEQEIGEEYWLGKIMKWFPRPEIQGMAAMFGCIELSVHREFYKKLNVELGLDTDEFYNAYVEDPELKQRMDFIGEAIDSEDKLYSLGVFSLLEGSVLYSNFGFLKHFQAEGKNKLKNLVSGIDFSVRDENIHSLAGAWLYRTHQQELKEYFKESPISFADAQAAVVEKVRSAAETIYEHECLIIDKIFEKGKIDGITDVQLKHFVESRINLCLQELGIPKLYEVKYNPIAEWFYKNINSYKAHDFFASTGNQYNRRWQEKEFVW
jgi:ribonucleotide reductase beta subunit family protein with ferritin-like domain